jgi:hypothetical protein
LTWRATASWITLRSTHKLLMTGTPTPGLTSDSTRAAVHRAILPSAASGLEVDLPITLTVWSSPPKINHSSPVMSAPILKCIRSRFWPISCAVSPSSLTLWTCLWRVKNRTGNAQLALVLLAPRTQAAELLSVLPVRLIAQSLTCESLMILGTLAKVRSTKTTRLSHQEDGLLPRATTNIILPSRRKMRLMVRMSLCNNSLGSQANPAPSLTKLRSMPKEKTSQFFIHSKDPAALKSARTWILWTTLVRCKM